MIPDPNDTIVAQASAAGPGRRAIVRLSGPQALAVVETVFHPAVGRPLAGSPRRVTPGNLKLSGVHSAWPADAYFFRGPASYTGQDLVEVHAVSSPPLVEQLVADLLQAGARLAGPGEFTLRAFLNGKKDLTRAEAVLAVIEADTDDELRIALAQLAGGLGRPLDRLRSDLLDLLADIEAGLDFVDEDIEFVGHDDQIARVSAALDQLLTVARQLDERSVSGRAIRVVLVGEPNAGKSSLFNALAGPAGIALVGADAGTTRDYLVANIDLAGVPVSLIDTAGWNAAREAIEQQAQQYGAEQQAQADLVVWCVPRNQELPAVRPESGRAEMILVRTKSDLPGEFESADRLEGEGVPASVMTPGGTLALRARLAERVASLKRSPNAPSQSRCRHHVLSALDALRRAREQILSHGPQELVAFELRKAIDPIGEMVGAVYTNDLLDRIFSRFCIGK